MEDEETEKRGYSNLWGLGSTLDFCGSVSKYVGLLWGVSEIIKERINMTHIVAAGTAYVIGGCAHYLARSLQTHSEVGESLIPVKKTLDKVVKEIDGEVKE